MVQAVQICISVGGPRQVVHLPTCCSQSRQRTALLTAVLDSLDGVLNDRYWTEGSCWRKASAL